MSSIIPYTFPETGTPVRTVTIDDEPWFVAADVAEVLGYSAASAMTRTLADDEKGVQSLHTPGGEQLFTVINEPGLFSAVLRSRVEGAQMFKRWVTHDVLPSIRRTGAYTVAPPAPALPDIATADGVLAMATIFQRTAQQLVEADARLRELEPKALAHDTFLKAGAGDVLIRQAAKLLAMRERDLRTFLVDEHLIYRRQALCGVTVWDFYAAHAAHFTATETVVTHTWGDCAHYTLHVTPGGLTLIQSRIAKRQAEMRNAIGGAA